MLKNSLPKIKGKLENMKGKLNKVKGKLDQQGASSEQEGSSEQKKPNYLVLALAIAVMVGGVGFVGLNLLTGGGQQRVSVDRSAVQDQGQSQGKRQSSGDTGSSALSKLQKKSPGGKNPLGVGKAESNQPSPDTKADKPAAPDKKTDKPAGEEQGQKKAEGISEPSPDSGLAGLAEDSSQGKASMERSSSGSADSPLRTEPKQHQGITQKLDAIKEAVSSGFEKMQSDIRGIEQNLAENREQITKLSNRISRVADSDRASGINPEKYASLKAQKKELKDKVFDLKKRVEDLKGKYDWVRHLEQEASVKLKKTKKKLAKVKERIKQRPVFANWKLVGLSEEDVVLKHRYDGTLNRLSEGDTFQGIEIEDVNYDKRIVCTEAGVLGSVRD